MGSTSSNSNSSNSNSSNSNSSSQSQIDKYEYQNFKAVLADLISVNQRNDLGGALGLQHSIIVITFENVQKKQEIQIKFDYDSESKYYMKQLEKPIKQGYYAKYEQSIKIDKNKNINDVIQISKNFCEENPNYNVLTNNCNHYVKYLVRNLYNNYNDLKFDFMENQKKNITDTLQQPLEAFTRLTINGMDKCLGLEDESIVDNFTLLKHR